MKWFSSWWSSKGKQEARRRRRARFEEQPFLDIHEELVLHGWGPSHGLPSLDFDTLFAQLVLRSKGIMHRFQDCGEPRQSPDGLLPFLMYGEGGVTISNEFILDHCLKEEVPDTVSECLQLLRSYLIDWQCDFYAWSTVMRRYYGQAYGPGLLGWWTAWSQRRALLATIDTPCSEARVVELLDQLIAQRNALTDLAVLAFIEIVDALMPANDSLVKAMILSQRVKEFRKSMANLLTL